MKTLLTIAIAALLSTSVQAGEEVLVPEISMDTVQSTLSSNADLWKSMDIDEDGSISKEEAVDSKEITSAWDDLDTNKDEKLDQEEFALFSSPQ